MSKLDRRVAVEIMGEPEPVEHPMEVTPQAFRGWRRGAHVPYYGALTEWHWEPFPFSSNLEYAMTAVDKYLCSGERYQDHFLGLDYEPDPDWTGDRWTASWVDENKEAEEQEAGETAPEAICNLLLALTELGEEKP